MPHLPFNHSLLFLPFDCNADLAYVERSVVVGVRHTRHTEERKRDRNRVERVVCHASLDLCVSLATHTHTHTTHIRTHIYTRALANFASLLLLRTQPPTNPSTLSLSLSHPFPPLASLLSLRSPSPISIIHGSRYTTYLLILSIEAPHTLSCPPQTFHPFPPSPPTLLLSKGRGAQGRRCRPCGARRQLPR